MKRIYSNGGKSQPATDTKPSDWLSSNEKPAHQWAGDREARFLEIYRTNEWNSSETRSGRGSDLSATEHVARIVDVALTLTRARTLLDAGCGDCHWLRMVRAPIEAYYGLDIVKQFTTTTDLRAKLPGCWNRCEFFKADIVDDLLPKCDLVLCRDVLPHFSYADILRTLNNLQKSGARYLLTTSFTARTNVDIETGRWRPLNLEAPPFSLPAPTQRWNEQCPLDGGRYSDKCLNLWPLNQVHLAQIPQ